MKIGVVGCGALGSYYGSLLHLGGHETWFLARSDFEVIRSQGVRIFSDNKILQATPHCVLTPGEIGPCDWVVIGLKTTANERLESLVTPLIGGNTLVITLQNGLGNEACLNRFLPQDQILGGLCFVCLNRIEPGVIRHQGFGRIVLGEYSGQALPRTHLIADVMRLSGIACSVTENLDRAHWEKLMWNVPFNGLGVAAGMGLGGMTDSSPDFNALPYSGVVATDQLLRDPGWRSVVQGLMEEIRQVCLKKGFNVPQQSVEDLLRDTEQMGAYRASTLIDFEQGKPLELNSLFFEPRRVAEELGVTCPRLQRLCEILEFLNGTRSE